MGTQVMKVLQHNNIQASNEQSSLVQLAEGTVVPTQGLFRIPVYVNGRPLEVKCQYLPTLATDLVLGLDFQVVQLIPRIDRGLAGLRALEEDQLHRLNQFLEQELGQFRSSPGRTNAIEHAIVLKPGVEPQKQRYYPRNPIVLVQKSSGKYRFCIDYRQVNQLTVMDAYPLPHIQGILSRLREARYISTLDLKSGYWQVPLSEASKPITAFTVPGRGLFQFNVLPFGLHSAPATFQRLLDRILGPEMDEKAFAYRKYYDV